MQFTDDEADKMSQKYQDSIAFAIARWKEQNPGQPEENAPWGKFCRDGILRCVGCDIAYCAILNMICDFV